MELRQPETATSVELHPSTYLSKRSHVLVGLDIKAVRDSGPGSEDLVYGGIRQWQDFANCQGIDHPDAFIGSDDPNAIQYAQSVCELCTVNEDCLAYAIATMQTVGVWGGEDMGSKTELKAVKCRTSRLGLARAAGVSSDTTS